MRRNHPERRTLEDVLAEPSFRSSRTEITMRNYALAVRRWNKAGVRYVDQVTPQAASRFVAARLAGGVVPVTVAVDFSALLAILDHEERAGRFDPDVQQRVRRCAPALPRRRELTAPFLTREQVDAYCAAADDPLAVFVVRLAVYTGLRASELAGLDWQDVDLQGRTCGGARPGLAA